MGSEGLDVGYERVHVRRLGGPAGAEADGAVRLVHPGPVGEAVVLRQLFQGGVRDYGELL